MAQPIRAVGAVVLMRARSSALPRVVSSASTRGSARRQPPADPRLALAAPGQGRPLTSLRTPCLVMDLAVAEKNADEMLQRAASLQCALRPHVKTHKTLEGAWIQTGGTARCITVSTLSEARFFADGGFDDILYAVPLTPDKLVECAALSRRLDAFHVLIDHPAQLDALLEQPAPGAGKVWSVVVMVDCGSVRRRRPPVCLRRLVCSPTPPGGSHLHTRGNRTVLSSSGRRSAYQPPAPRPLSQPPPHESHARPLRR